MSMFFQETGQALPFLENHAALTFTFNNQGKSKAAIVFAHHFSKGNQSGKESQDRIFGSGVWGRAVDTNVSITAHESENAYTLEATPRGFKKIDPFVIKWEYPLKVRDDGRRLRREHRAWFQDLFPATISPQQTFVKTLSDNGIR